MIALIKNVFHYANLAMDVIETDHQKLLCGCVQMSDRLDLCNQLVMNTP